MDAQFGIALLNLGEHRVEAVAQDSEFIAARLDRSQRIVLFAGHLRGHLSQFQDGIGDDALQQARQQHRQHQRRREHRGHDDDLALDLGVEHIQRDSQVNASDDSLSSRLSRVRPTAARRPRVTRVRQCHSSCVPFSSPDRRMPFELVPGLISRVELPGIHQSAR